MKRAKEAIEHWAGGKVDWKLQGYILVISAIVGAITTLVLDRWVG